MRISDQYFGTRTYRGDCCMPTQQARVVEWAAGADAQLPSPARRCRGSEITRPYPRRLERRLWSPRECQRGSGLITRGARVKSVVIWQPFSGLDAGPQSACRALIARRHSIAYHGGEPTHRTPALDRKHPQAAGVLAWGPCSNMRRPERSTWPRRGYWAGRRSGR